MEDITLYVVVECLLTHIEFWMVLNYYIRRLSLLKQRCNDIAFLLGFCTCHVDTLPGLHECFMILILCLLRIISILIKSATRVCWTTIASSRRTISSGACKWNVVRTLWSAVSSMNTLFISRTLKRHLAFIGQDSVVLYFLAYSRFVFA